MIIYGVKTTEVTASEGTFACPRCQTVQNYRHVVLRRWFTLYFLPVIPLGRLGEQIECQACFSRFVPDDATGQPTMQSLAGSPFEDKPGTPPVRHAPNYQPPRTTPLAITSLLFGISSPVFLCLCGLSLVSSLAAIITGHLALSTIERSPVPMTGRGMARTGLVFGYLLFLVSLGYWGFIGYSVITGHQRPANQTVQNPYQASGTASDRLHAAEMRIMANDDDGFVSGNTPEAKALSADYSKVLRAMREKFFTKGKKHRISLTKGQFIVHCELHDQSCAFLVHVPSYRNYADDAKESLETHAWHLAQQLAIGRLKPQTRLAVGMRGVVLYGAVIVGSVPTRTDMGGLFTRGKRDDLLAFFATPIVIEETPPWKSNMPQAEFDPMAPTQPTPGPRELPKASPHVTSENVKKTVPFRKLPAPVKGLSQLEDVSSVDKKGNANGAKKPGTRGAASKPLGTQNKPDTRSPTGLSQLEPTSPAGKSKVDTQADGKQNNRADEPPWRSVGKGNR